MKHSTFSAFVANSIQKVLQGYTKGIRFVAFLLVLFTVNIGTASAEKSIDFESGTATYSDWTFTNMTSQQSGSITAKGGSYYGTTGGKSTASIQTKNKISSPKSISCYVSKQSNNTSSSTWYIQTSTNGSSWSNVKSQSATSMSKGSWVEFTADLSSYSNVYVRIYYSGSTAVRNIDNLVLTEGTTTSYDVNWMVNGENYTTGSPSTSVSEGSKVTILPTAPSLDCSGKTFVGWSNKEVTDESELDVFFTTAENSPAITEPTTFHAVFATKGSNQTATFDAATISGLTKSSSSLTWTHNTSGIALYLSAGQRYTNGTPNTFTVTNGTSNYCQLSAPVGVIMSKVVATLSGTNYKINSVSTPWTLSTSSTTQTISSTNGSDYLKMSATSDYQIRITNLVVTYTTYSDYTTTCTSCTAPTSVTIGGAWDKFGGETISLTATPNGGTGDYSYQWQKYYDGTWNNITDNTTATTANLVYENCDGSHSGTYRCVVSTGTDCSTASDGLQVKVYTLECYTNGTNIYHFTRNGNTQSGTLTLNLNANTAYKFKVHVDNDYYGNGGTINKDETNWVLGAELGTPDLTVNSGLGGTFTFTIDYSTGGNNTTLGVPEISVTYPRKTIYLNPGVWNTDGAKYAIYYFIDGHNAWSDLFVGDACGTYTTIPQWNGVTMIAVRLNSDATGGTWDKKWNQTGNIAVTNDDYIAITGWGNNGGNSPHTYSTYTPATYSITFNGNSNTGGSMTNVTGITCGENHTLAENGFARTGYTFAGWATSDNGEKVYDDKATISNITSNITLYAKWTPNANTAYTVKHYKQQLDGTYSETPDETDNLTGTTAATVTPAVKSYTGFTAPSTKTVTIAADGSTVVEYQYTRNSYILTWNLDGGTISTQGTAAGEVKYGAALTAPTVTKTGHTFAGWSPAVAATMPAANATYTAQWTKVYTVTFYSNGSAYGESQTLESGNTVTFPTTDPTSCDTDKYPHFIGWTINPINGSTDEKPELVTSATVSNANLEFHAVFAAGEGGGSGDYEKVTSALDDWSGEYLIVYEDGNVAFNGALNTLDAEGNGIAVAISDNTIASNATTDAAKFTIAKVDGGYSIKSASGYYIGRTSNSNGLNAATGTVYVNTITYSDGITITSDANPILRYNAASNQLRFRYYKSGQQPIALYKKGSAANYTSFITSCCAATANLVLTPNPASPIALDIDGNALTTISFATENSEEALYYRPTITPSENTSLTINGTWNDYTRSAGSYTYNFTATGTYTIKQEFKQDGYDCKKSASTTITVAANPILQVSEPTITSECGTEGTPVAVTIDSRYLTGSSLTASVETTSDADHGTFKICATENGDFATTDLTGLSAGKDDKATVTIYVRYDAALDNIDDATGTLTITDGTTSQTVDLTTTPTCGTSIRMTPTDANSVRVTTANGQWTRTQTAIHLRGSYLLQNLTGDQGAKVELTSSNSNFKFVKPDVASSGTVKYESEKITNNTWEADVYLVYTPTSYDANETTTITAKVTTFGGTTEHATATLTAYGRSFPETFVLALNTGSEWVALPADMIAPYGDCTTGVGTHDPYPITVNDNDNPTTATLAPARAVYKGAARNTPTTNPWTIQFESNTQAGYYLFGSVHNVDANTSIANLAQATGEGLKWELNTEDNITYRLSQMNAPAFQLGYNATANYMGQYQSTATNFKYDFRILPVTSTCTYYIEPIMTLVDYTDDEAKVRIQYDGTNLYQISTDNKANWTNVEGEIDCLDLTFTLPNSTYRGKDVWLKPQGDLCEPVESSASCHIPAPVINNPGDQNFVGTVNQPFSGTFTITGSDLYKDISAITITNNSNPAIGATINNGTITVTMAAAAVGTYTTNLTFDAVGAEDVIVKVTITIQDLAIMQITPANITDGYCCLDGSAPAFTFSPIYVNGSAITTASGASNGISTFSVIDLDNNNATVNATYSVSSGAVTLTVPLANLTLTHRYQVSYTNLNDGDKTLEGLPYANASYTFTAINCNTITALPACPITNTSFTANWVGDATKLNVYTKSETEVLNQDITSTTLNLWKSYSNDYTAKWLYGLKGDMDYTLNGTYGFQVSSTGSSWAFLYTPQIGKILSGITESTEIEVTIEAYCYNTANKVKCFVIDEEPTNTTYPQNGNTVTFDGVSASSWTSELLPIPAYTEVSFKVSGLTSTSRIAITALNASKTTYIKTVKIKSVATSSVGEYDVTGTSHDVSGLTANTQYYYTVSDGTNTSNEIAVTTYENAPSLKFYSDEACTDEIDYTTVLGGEKTTVYVKGTEVPGCDIATSVSSGYGMDDSGLNYNVTTGAVTGSIILTLTDANTTEGTLTLTDGKGNTYVLPIVSSDCPAGFGTMALPASDINSESAQANWRTTLDFGDDKSGTLHLYKNGIVNRELIVNGDFETGTLTAGWSNGLNGGDKDAVYSFSEFDIVSSNVHDEGSYCLSVTGNGSKLLAFQNMSVMYADSIILTAGTYRMSAWVKMPEASGYDDKKQSFALGLIGGKKSAVKVVCVSDITIVQSNNTYVQLTYEFTLTSTVTACPAIGANVRGETFRDFYLDDVSLMCTSIGQSDEPYLSIDIDDLSEDGFLALTGLSGNTEYTYVIQNADGCSSNSITFQTTEAGAPVIEPNDVTISCQVGNSVNGLMTLSVKDVYSDIYISNSCTERITLNTTKLPKEGGVVNFTFTPLNTDQGGETGICTISFTTKGLATPVTGIITWTVTAGVDPDLPIIDVTDITNTSLNIEHNVEGDGVQIVISRERQEDEIEDNIGEEIFFSKYYEAYMHKKLWAIYNPTKEKISLKNTYVWRSNGKGTDWNIEGGLDLSQMGNIESGYIYPNEELIVYTSDQVGECEQSKADMTNWVAMSSSDPALSFSGNDALLLVRKDIDGDADNPPTESVELDSYGDPHELNWRTYTDEGGNKWWMLDIIGARQNNNKPDITATGSWTWTCNGKTEKGDAAGWYGDQGEHLNATLYKDCGYVLSTNRCLLIRKESVKSGYKAINENIGDMFTLGKNDYPTEWRGAHVPQDGNQEKTSCENFTYVGGYDYESYYNAWTDLDNLQPAVQQPDGSWLVEGVDVPNFYCHPLLIEVLITDVVNGEEVENVSAYLEYKVPIVVDEDAKTNDTRYFVEPTPENVLSPEICAECDVVIRDGATLTHIDDGREVFRNMQVYPTAKFNIPEGLSMQLAGLHMYAKNDDVGYAILNDNGSSIHADNIVHIKRIDDVYWYPFSLPYDCNVSSIYQLNGKSMGEYWVDWGIKYYDGHARQVTGDNYTAGATSVFWKKLEPDQTLKAHQGYIIGLFTTEWTGQMKSIYFPPVESTEYTENSGESKTTYISNWPENLDCEPRHHGWNFTSLPYISLFSSQNGDGTTNSNSLMMGSQTDPYATSSTVYVSIPDGGDSRTYTQVSAAATKLEPFKPYFVQAIDPTDGQSHNDITLTYSKGGRTLEKMPARAASNVRPTIVVEMRIANADASLVDNAGVLVSERYTANYEIAADLTKMYAADRKPQLFTRAANNNEMLAYNALPDPLAQNIPLGIYLPNNDEYTISIIDYASQLSDAEAVYLLHNGEIVANLLYADYTIPTQQAGLINGYSLDIRRRQDTPTNIDNIADGGPVITVVDGQIVIQQLPEDAQLYITDVLGRVLYQQANVPHIITFQAPVTGVYNVVITTDEQQFTQKTIVR